MVRGEATIEIARPVDVVFDFVATHFFVNYPRWSPEVKELEPEQQSVLEIGASARQVRVDQGRRSDTIIRVVALEPGSRIAFEGHGSAAFTSGFDFADRGDATELTFHFELSQLKLYMRPFEKLIRRAIANGAERTVHNIKHLIETER